MSHYRVCMIEIKHHEVMKFMKFDNKEDAEHHAKNQSVIDTKHIYEVQKSNAGEFSKFKSYMNGEEV